MRARLLLLAAACAAALAAAPVRADTFPVTFCLAWGEQGPHLDQFNTPFGVGHDDDGYVYVIDNEANRVQKYDAYGNFVLAWGSSGGGAEQFLNPEDVAVGPDGLVYVADSRHRRIQRFTTGGAFVDMWTTPTPGPSSDRARGVAFDSSGDVYVTFGQPARVEKYHSDGTYLGQWDVPGNAENPAGGALGIAISTTDDVYVVDPTYLWSGVRRFDTEGNLRNEWGGSGTGAGQFDTAIHVDVDALGRVFVTDYGNSRVQVFTATGGYLGQFGGPNDGPGQFDGPRGITVTSDGYIFVVDGLNYRVVKFGLGLVAVEPTSWARLKAMFRTVPADVAAPAE
jgi:DNA-binding beta-propeller fold protein YncE